MIDMFLKGRLLKKVLMQYKCMEREIGKLSMEGFYFLICLVYREYSGRNAALAERNQ